MVSFILAVTGVLLLAAGPVLAAQGLVGRRAVSRELERQRIRFPLDGLSGGLSRYAGTAVHTGPRARAFADLIDEHVSAATGGRTYAEITDEWQAGGRTDEKLAKLRQTAFMAQSLRGGLLSAYQAWQVTLLVVGLGGLCTVMGVAFLALATR